MTSRVVRLMSAALASILLGCSPTPTATPDLVATEVAVQKAAIATLTAEAPTATATTPPTDTPTATSTQTPSPTATTTHTATVVPPTPTCTTPAPLDIDPSSVALTLSDLPPGFYVVEADTGPTTNRDVADTHSNPDEYLQLLEVWGRTSGWRSSFSREPDLGNLFQVQLIENYVSVYGTADGAHLALVNWPVDASPRFDEFRQVSVPGLGHEAQGYMAKLTSESWTVVSYVLDFRFRNVFVSVRVFGVEGGVSMDDATPLAEAILRRLGG